jgi:thiol-disulfide isomerase/thioredoxin
MAEGGDLLDLGRYRGKVVLLNFWATWCTPCVRELPALDRLQSILGRRDFEVVALSIDDGGIEVPASFAKRLELSNLNVYLDFTGTTAEVFPLYGLPISCLIDREGIMVGYIVGAVDWDSPEAVKFLTYLMEQAGGGSGG